MQIFIQNIQHFPLQSVFFFSPKTFDELLVLICYIKQNKHEYGRRINAQTETKIDDMKGKSLRFICVVCTPTSFTISHKVEKVKH